MQKANLKKEQLGLFLVGSPKEGGRLDRSLINYHNGIPEIDAYLQEKKFSELEAEFGIDLYNNAVLFMLYRGKEAIWAFPIERQNIVSIIAHHNQKLHIRKSSKITGGALGVIGAMGIIGGIVAGTVDALTSSKDIPPDQLVLGSLFEIHVRSDQEEPEKIIVSTTDKHKESVESFLKKITEAKTDEKKSCYIATVCYGDIDAPEVEAFRLFRDKTLSKTLVGRLMISLYYKTSPYLSRYLKGRDRTNRLIRFQVLDRLLKLIK